MKIFNSFVSVAAALFFIIANSTVVVMGACDGKCLFFKSGTAKCGEAFNETTAAVPDDCECVCFINNEYWGCSGALGDSYSGSGGNFLGPCENPNFVAGGSDGGSDAGDDKDSSNQKKITVVMSVTVAFATMMTGVAIF